VLFGTANSFRPPRTTIDGRNGFSEPGLADRRWLSSRKLIARRAGVVRRARWCVIRRPLVRLRAALAQTVPGAAPGDAVTHPLARLEGVGGGLFAHLVFAFVVPALRGSCCMIDPPGESPTLMRATTQRVHLPRRGVRAAVQGARNSRWRAAPTSASASRLHQWR
jgi:hypothetical protein